MKLRKTQISGSINKVLLGHGHVHLFSCFHIVVAELGSWTETMWTVSLQYLPSIWPFTETADIDHRLILESTVICLIINKN